jgi:outer membrane protein TolC
MLVGTPGVAQQPPSPTGSVTEEVPANLELRQAIEIALRAHPALVLDRARSGVAKSGIAAAGSQYRPYIAADGGLGKTLAGPTQVRRDQGGEVTEVDPFYSARLRLVVPIVREGRLPFMTFPSEEAARHRYDAIRLGENRTRSEIVGVVTIAFLTALSTREDVKLGERTVELNRLLLDNARRRFDQQLIPLADVLAAEAALAAAEADLAVARTSYTSRLQELLIAMGLDPGTGRAPELIDAGEILDTGRSLDELLNEAYEKHPAVRAQQARVREAMAVLGRLVSERYPTLDASLVAGNVDDFSLLDRWALRALLQLNWRVWDFGHLGLRIKQQTEVIEAERLVLGEVKNRIAQQVVAAHREVAVTQSRLSAEQRAIESAEERLRAARARFQQELIPRAEVLRAELDLEASRKTLLQTQYAIRVGQARLAEAMGAD